MQYQNYIGKIYFISTQESGRCPSHPHPNPSHTISVEQQLAGANFII